MLCWVIAVCDLNDTSNHFQLSLKLRQQQKYFERTIFPNQFSRHLKIHMDTYPCTKNIRINETCSHFSFTISEIKIMFKIRFLVILNNVKLHFLSDDDPEVEKEDKNHNKMKFKFHKSSLWTSNQHCTTLSMWHLRYTLHISRIKENSATLQVMLLMYLLKQRYFPMTAF